MQKDSRQDVVSVYSTDKGRICPGCGEAVGACTCGKKQAPAGKNGTVYISRQTKGRKGKGVSLVSGVPLAPVGLADLAKKLKQKCGSGGTVKDGIIEIQGDHRQALKAELERLGYSVKLSGG